MDSTSARNVALTLDFVLIVDFPSYVVAKGVLRCESAMTLLMCVVSRVRVGGGSVKRKERKEKECGI